MPETFLFQYLIFPALIVIARIADVSLGTLRIILLSKGFKRIAPIIGFFEVFIWIMIAKQIITDVSSITAYIAYALGYALGTYVGMAIESKLSLGKVLIRVIVSMDSTALEKALRENKFGLTSVDADGRDGKVRVLFIVVNRTELNKIIDLIRQLNPKAFYTIESIQSVNAGYFAQCKDESNYSRLARTFVPGRKSK